MNKVWRWKDSNRMYWRLVCEKSERIWRMTCDDPEYNNEEEEQYFDVRLQISSDEDRWTDVGYRGSVGFRNAAATDDKRVLAKLIGSMLSGVSVDFLFDSRMFQE